MTREEALKSAVANEAMAKLQRAFAAGGTIQLRAVGLWHDMPDPTFELPPDQYRTKPQSRVLWMRELPDGKLEIPLSHRRIDGKLEIVPWETRQDALALFPHMHAIKFIEAEDQT